MHLYLHPSFAQPFLCLHAPVVRCSLSRTMMQHGQQPSPIQRQLQPCGYYYPGPMVPHVVSIIQPPCFMQHSHMQPSPMLQHLPQFPPPHGYCPANIQDSSSGMCPPSPADGPSSLTDETAVRDSSKRLLPYNHGGCVSANCRTLNSPKL